METLNIVSFLLDRLLCPDCRGSLYIKEEKIKCRHCDRIFKQSSRYLDMMPCYIFDGFDTWQEEQERFLNRREKSGVTTVTEDLENEVWGDQNKRFIENIRSVIRNPVLDIGCKNGWIGEALGLDYRNYIGLDPISDCFTAKYLFIWAMAERLPFINSTFNTIIIKESMDHFLNLEMFKNECLRVLNSKGILIIQQVIINNYTRRNNLRHFIRGGYKDGIQIKKMLFGRTYDDHAHYFTRGKIVRMFKGLQVIGISYIGNEKVLFIFKKTQG